MDESEVKIMTKGAMWSLSIKTVALSAATDALSPFTIVSSAEAGSDIQGCRERTDSSTKYPTSLTYCFLGKGRLQGWDIDSGHGVDFSGRWEKRKSHKIGITIGMNSDICDYALDGQKNVLHLENCTVSSMEGSFGKPRIDLNRGWRP